MMDSGLGRPGRIESTDRKIFDAAVDGIILIDSETGLVVEANAAAGTMHGYTRQEFIGLSSAAFIDPLSLASFTEYFKRLGVGGIFDERARQIRRDGSTFYADWRGTAFAYAGRSCLLANVRDVSKHIEAERSLHERAETRTHEQATLLEISHTLASTLEFRPGLILDQLREIIEYTHGALFALEDSTLVTLAMRGASELEQSSPYHIQLRGAELLAGAFNGHKPVRIGDVWSDNPQAQEVRSLLAGEASVLLRGMHSWMWVPLAVKSRTLGGMGVAFEKPNHFTSHHADLALSVADQAAITMINAELYGHAQALAVLEERQRLARNLHDAVNQSLFSAGLIAEVLPRLWDRDQSEARRSLEDLRRLTRGAMAEMRALLAELRPSTLTDANLGDLVRLLGNAFTGRTNMPVNVTLEGQGVLPAEVQVAFYRVCQEALNNVAKHARASVVDIHLENVDSAVELSIRDDGQGFSLEARTSGHYGLSMMLERAEAVGAVLSVASQPGHGTEITIRWKRTPPKEDA